MLALWGLILDAGTVLSSRVLSVIGRYDPQLRPGARGLGVLIVRQASALQPAEETGKSSTVGPGGRCVIPKRRGPLNWQSLDLAVVRPPLRGYS